MSTNGVEQIGRERHVQHLFDENTGHDLGGFRIADGVERVERTQIGRQREVLELNGPLQMLTQAFKCGDAGKRRHFQLCRCSVHVFLLPWDAAAKTERRHDV